MAIKEHPVPGTILICDFNQGFREPEMVKRRPVVVLSPKIGARPKLCTVVALSTTPPAPKLPYHCELEIDPPLPKPWSANPVWVKGDMINAVGFHRLDLVSMGKDVSGKRIYRYDIVTPAQMKLIRVCILRALNLNPLTKHL